MNNDMDMEWLRKRIADLHARMGADGPEAEIARERLLALLADHGKTWTLLTLTIQDGFEQLARLTPDDLAQHARASFADLLSSPDDVAAIIAAHDQADADARQQIKTILARHGLNWTDLTNLLRDAMEQLDEWQPNLLDAICDTINEYVTFKRQPHDAVTAALWMIHTYVSDRFMHTPRLGAFSQDPRSGKSVLITQLGGRTNTQPAQVCCG
jgi:hypothetical protein